MTMTMTARATLRRNAAAAPSFINADAIRATAYDRIAAAKLDAPRAPRAQARAPRAKVIPVFKSCRAPIAPPAPAVMLALPKPMLAICGPLDAKSPAPVTLPCSQAVAPAAPLEGLAASRAKHLVEHPAPAGDDVKRWAPVADFPAIWSNADLARPDGRKFSKASGAVLLQDRRTPAKKEWHKACMNAGFNRVGDLVSFMRRKAGTEDLPADYIKGT